MTVSLSASVLIALSCSFLSCVGLCAVLLPPAERVMARRRVAVVEVPSWRKREQDLPPVGGIAIIVSAAAGILISAVFGGSVSENCIFLLIVAVLFSAVGLTDDLLTLTQNKRFSMHSSVKTVLRALLAVGFAVYSYNYNGGGYVPLSVFASGVDLGVFYIPIAARTVLIFSCSAMITDGSDGICTTNTGMCSWSASELAGWVRRNFSTIIDLPLLVGPTSSRLGMRCLFGHA